MIVMMVHFLYFRVSLFSLILLGGYLRTANQGRVFPANIGMKALSEIISAEYTHGQ